MALSLLAMLPLGVESMNQLALKTFHILQNSKLLEDRTEKHACVSSVSMFNTNC